MSSNSPNRAFNTRTYEHMTFYEQCSWKDIQSPWDASCYYQHGRVPTDNKSRGTKGTWRRAEVLVN